MRFSVLMPAYKIKFLREAISSVLAQSYCDFELIIVDDNSPDDLYSIVSEFSDDRIIFHKNIIGFGAVNVVGNWNKCLKYSTGDYVICMGDDDELSKCCLEEYVKLIKKYPGLDCYHTRMAYIDENSCVYDLQIDRPERDTVYSAIWHTWKGRHHVLGDWLFSTDFLRRNRGFVSFPCAWSSDTITVYKAAISNGIANTSYIGFRYRTSKYTISSNKNDFLIPKLQSWCEVEKWYLDFLKIKPNNPIDLFYWNYIKENLKNEMSNSKRMEIRKCMVRNWGQLLKLWLSCNQFGIKKSIIFKEILYSYFFSFYGFVLNCRKIVFCR